MNMIDLNSPLLGLCLISSVSRCTICCSRLTVWRLQPLLKRLPCSRADGGPKRWPQGCAHAVGPSCSLQQRRQIKSRAANGCDHMIGIICWPGPDTLPSICMARLDYDRAWTHRTARYDLSC